MEPKKTKTQRSLDYGIDWKDLNDAERIERLQYVINNMTREISSIRNKFHSINRNLENHQHNQDGKPMISLKDMVSHQGGYDTCPSSDVKFI